jgi:hypothetical protein
VAFISLYSFGSQYGCGRRKAKSQPRLAPNICSVGQSLAWARAGGGNGPLALLEFVRHQQVASAAFISRYAFGS